MCTDIMASSSATVLHNYWKPFSLHNGHELPAVGFGTFRIKEKEMIYFVIEAALNAGYRSFDTAAVYGNEVFIGEALLKLLPKFNLTRQDVFVTSKLSNADHGSKNRVIDAFEKTEANLGFPPDLYLIHFPGSARLDPKDQRNKGQRHAAWSAMAQLYDMGRVNSIGVSNFTVQHLQELLVEYHSDIPVVNQVEWHPWYHDEVLLEFCNKNAIQLQGYHSLGGTEHSASLLKNTLFKDLADDYAVSPSQVLLTWSLQRGVAVIPKSTNINHITQNIALNFQLNPEDVEKINHFTAKQVKLAWDPKNVF